MREKPSEVCLTGPDNTNIDSTVGSFGDIHEGPRDLSIKISESLFENTMAYMSVSKCVLNSGMETGKANIENGVVVDKTSDPVHGPSIGNGHPLHHTHC